MICSRCKKDLPETEFWKNNKVCKHCNSEAWRKRMTPEKREQYNERHRQFYDINIAKYLLRQAKHRAKKKGLECTITFKDIHIPERCPIFDVPLVKNRGQWKNNSYSLDRIDSSKGYVPGNVKVISWWANYVKADMTIDQVERLLKYMRGEL